MRALHVEQWLPEISKADAVDRDRPISLNIFSDVELVDMNTKVLSWISVADLVWRGAIPPQTGGERIGTSSNTEGRWMRKA